LLGALSGSMRVPAASIPLDQIARLLLTGQEDATTWSADWLVKPISRQATVTRSADNRQLILDNGLLRRTFRLTPEVATVALDNPMTGVGLLRAVKPEASVTLDGTEYAVGGLWGQPERAYLRTEWLDSMTNAPSAFRCVGFETGRILPRLEWKRRRHSADLPWPPPGVTVTFHFEPPAGCLPGVKLDVHYDLYDGLPLLAKWLTLENGSTAPLRLNRFTSEILAPAEVESAVDDRDVHEWRLPAIQVFSDYTFHGMDVITANRTTEWLEDPDYTSQVNYRRKMPALLVSRPPLGPEQQLAPGDRFKSFRTWVLVFDSDDRERQGLAIRRAYRTLAPWCTENPIMMHVRNSETKAFRAAVDQCAAVGFEMIIYTFGSGLEMENTSPAYLARIKADVDYAHGRGLEVGAYSLLASRRVSDEVDVINPKTGKPEGAIFGNSPCLATRWAEEYFAKIRNFVETTGLDLVEHDGSYPGDVCASTNHSGHVGLDDSQWRQWRIICDCYAWCRARGVYLNVPDHYFFNGSSKTGMGYREDNWSLPRAQQIVLGRQNIFDGTWTKTPSMGWMFVPLTEYQGGGAAATLEPLAEHLEAYAGHLVNNFGAGVQACYRGPRLYDAEPTRALVKRWVDWFKAHRDILESDLIHLRRADGRDWDGFLHVNPQLREKGLAMLFNPRDGDLERTIRFPLYYTGLTRKATVRFTDGTSRRLALDRGYRIEVPVKIPAHGSTWVIFE
jgi:hypothetical protein